MSVASITRKLSAVVAFSFFAINTNAAPLAPGTGIPAPVEPNPVGGAVVFASGPALFSAPGPTGFSGFLSSQAIAGDTSNGLGGLTFVYQLHNNATSNTPLERLVLPDFSGFLTDVSYLPAGGQAPTTVDRSGGPGAIIGWNFIPPAVGIGALLQGATTDLLVVQTNAPGYDIVQNASVIDGSTAAVASIGPSLQNVLPEPTSLTFVAIGIASIGLRRR